MCEEKWVSKFRSQFQAEHEAVAVQISSFLNRQHIVAPSQATQASSLVEDLLLFSSSEELPVEHNGLN